MSLGDVPGGYEAVDNPLYELEDTPDLPPLRDVFGVVRSDDGALRIPTITAELASPHGALHLGPINISLEAAISDEIESTTGSAAWQVAHWMIMMVKPGTVGPFKASATVFEAAGGRLGAEATLIDEGNHSRTIATATALYTKVDA